MISATRHDASREQALITWDTALITNASSLEAHHLKVGRNEGFMFF